MGLYNMLNSNYKNSEGTVCNEICLTCIHRNLCFELLEYCGMIFQAGERIRFDCEQIIANPEYYKNKFLNGEKLCTNRLLLLEKI